MSIQALLSASQSMARMQTMQSARTQMQGTANVLRIESKLDGGNEKKEAKAAALEEESSNLMGDLMGELTDVNKTLVPDEDVKTEETKAEESTAEETSKEEEVVKKSSKTDTIELSDTAAKQLSQNIHAAPVVLEAVTYKADGSTKPSAQAKAAPTFEATA